MRTTGQQGQQVRKFERQRPIDCNRDRRTGCKLKRSAIALRRVASILCLQQWRRRAMCVRVLSL